MDNLKPFTGQLDADVATLQPFSGKLDDGESKFKSGEAFKDTKELAPDLKGLWEQFKKEWENRSNTPMTREIAIRMMQDEHAAGSAVLDTVGALPAMAAGGIAGVGSAISNMNASKGLETGGKVMNALLPSTLLGNEDHHEKEGYKAAMAPFTGIMDTLNAVPQGYGEILNAAGHPAAANQVTDAGKLGIMAVLGTKGAMHMYKSLTGKDATSIKDASDKLEALVKKEPTLESASTKQNGATDRGIPPTEENPQGQLFSGKEDAPTNPIPAENQIGLFDKPTDIETIPYDLSMGDIGANHPGLELGGLKQRMDQGPQPQNPALRNASGELDMPFTADSLSLVPKEEAVPPTAPAPVPNVGTRDAARAKLQEQAAYEAQQGAEAARKAREVDQAHGSREATKEGDYNRMEAQKELDFADSVKDIEQGAGVSRRAFLDRDNLDFHGDRSFAHEALGDKSLMHPEHTGAMVDALHKGDLNTVLDTIAKNHESVLYRNLADYLKGKLEGINIKMHDEGILTLGERHATGYYDPATRTVGFSKVGAVSPHTVLHELVHAMTSDFINSRPNDLRVMGLKDLFNKLDLGKEFPGIVNLKEFVAEAFSNPEFQAFLKEHKVANRSMWRRFVDNVKSILGLSASTRNHVTDALEHALDLGKQVMEANKPNGLEAFKDVGMPSKLADLMVTRKKQSDPLNTLVHEDVQRLKIPALKDPISDFKFEDRPMEEIIKEAHTQDDIPNTLMEKMSHQLQAGGLFESLKTRNLVVKKTFERITRATQEAAENIKKNLTDPDTGLKAYMRELTPDQKGEIHAAMILHEGQKVLSSHELREAGFNEKQVAYYNKQRELDDQFFKEINERRAGLGMRPMDKRVAHMAGRFMGDFSRFVKDKDGKIVGYIAGSTSRELTKATKYLMEKHPEYNFGKREYKSLGRGRSAGDRFNGLMEALNLIAKTDTDFSAVMDSYKEYIQKDAINYLNATRHAKAKVKDAGGIIGSEGHKPWLDTIKNAEEGMKAQLAYYEQGYQWMAMEKAVNDLKPLLGDETLALSQRNALEWANQYKDHALGRNQGPISDAANWTASKLGELTGVGHSNLFKASNVVKHRLMQKFMGFMNIPFSVTQMMQPLQTNPAMVMLLKSRGLEFSAMDAQYKAMQTHFNALSGEKMGKLDAFEKQALNYAERMGIMDVKMADHTKDINSSPIGEAFDKFADWNITVPEKLTRGTAFLFYSHILKDAGIPVKDIFGAAENMTNMTMVNYHPIERPMGYAKLGWLGDIASTLTRYKHNQGSQLAFYTREGIRADAGLKSAQPMATFLATSIAFSGAMGFFAFQEADAIYQLVTEFLGKPDTLTNVVLSSNMPEVISHGMFSTLGLDMTTRFSNANVLPNSIPEALMPYGSAVLDLAKSTGRFVVDPTSTTRQKQLVKSLAPQSVQGVLENKMFTEKQADGSNLYINGTNGPNLGKGRVYRSDGDMTLRAFGFRNTQESKELAKNYSDSQIDKANKNVVDSILTKVKEEAMDGSLDEAKLKRYTERAAKYGESPDSFTAKLVTWNEYRHLSQAKQQMLQNAQGGFRGAVNIKEGR